jgi:uncharacterized protein
VTSAEAEAVRRICTTLGLPGIVDIHTHFMPQRVMDKVWAYFDSAGPPIGRNWSISYRISETRRVQLLRQFGVRRFTSLVYPHKPRMARWLNDWAAQFAQAHPDCLSTATFYPEPDCADYVAAAIEQGTKVFKAHIQVGRYDPNDRMLERVWEAIEAAQVPVVIHCGSGPTPGKYTGPQPIRRLLRHYPRLSLIVAHMGMPEYADFLDICENFPTVRLDTTMVFTPFTDITMPFPRAHHHRLAQLGERILFGSDFPNIPYRYADALKALVDMQVSDHWLRNVLYHNAARLFALTT